MNLSGKTAIVTGGNSGIGRAIAIALAREGANIVIGSRRKRENERAAAEIQKNFPDRKVIALEIDVTNEADCERLIAETASSFGKIDVLVNNAGIGGGAKIAETSTEEFDRVLKTNLYGAFWCARAVFRHMKMRGGYIINISSIAGKEAWSGLGAYSASKFGIMALTQALADEGKPHNIKCTAICPALVATPMTGVRGAEFLQPEDVAETVLYLLRLSPAVWPIEVVLPRKGAQ
jgi:3-oxoacyl-[acyl-carrier protein] reductase